MSGPTVTGPTIVSMPTVSVAITGVSIVDPFAASSAGTMYLCVSCNVGKVSMIVNGTRVASNSIVVPSPTFVQANAALASLIYEYSINLSNDTITIDVWDQAGANTISTILVNATSPVPTPTPVTHSDSTGTTAFRIADMMERFGVNTFSSESVTANTWGSYPADYSTGSVISAIQWMTGKSGMTIQVREYHFADKTWQSTWCPTINAATGSQFTMAIGAEGTTADVPTMMTMASSSSTGTGWLKWCEGLNEPNTNFGNGTIPAISTIAIQEAIWAAASPLKGNTHPVTIVGPSIVFGLPYPAGYIVPAYATTAQMATIVANESIANCHFYPPSEVDLSDGSTLGGAFEDVVNGFNSVYNNQQILITEWHPTLYNSTPSLILNPVYDAYYAPCFFLSAFRAGILGWFWYALLDFGTAFYSGLFPQTGGVNARPVAYTIQAMYQLTGDTGSAKHTFSPGKINYTISGLPAALAGAPNSGGQSMLFQNSSGTYFLFIWNAQATPEGATVSVTVKFNNHAMTSVKEYKISDASSSTAPMTALQSLTNANSVTIQLNASVHLLVIDY